MASGGEEEPSVDELAIANCFCRLCQMKKLVASGPTTLTAL